MSRLAYSYWDDPDVPVFKDDKPIIVFDGHCNLCSRFANFIIKHDKKNRLRLLAAQSEIGEALYAHYGLKPEDYDTNLLIENGRIRIKSDGSMAILSYPGWPWKLINISRILPHPIGDVLYNHVGLQAPLLGRLVKYEGWLEETL